MHHYWHLIDKATTNVNYFGTSNIGFALLYLHLLRQNYKPLNTCGNNISPFE